MAQPNPNDTKFEQQRSNAAEEALENQTEKNHSTDNESSVASNTNDGQETDKDK